MASIIGVETLQHTNGTTAATIDSSGRILQPANPKFSVRLETSTSSNDYTSTSTSNVEFDTEEFDVGGCVAISSNVATFTALVTGYYQFNLSVTFQDTGGAGHLSTYLSIDGSTTSSSTNEDYRTLTDPQGGSYIALTSSHLIYLTANQTVNPRLHVHSDTSVVIRVGTRFSDYLVG